LELQFGDLNFRETVLIQFLILFQGIQNPANEAQKKQFVLSEKEKEKIKACDQRIRKHLKDEKKADSILGRLKSFMGKIDVILHRESFWVPQLLTLGQMERSKVLALRKGSH